MDSEEPVERLIKDAIASGELAPTRGVGKPIENLLRDEIWLLDERENGRSAGG